MPVIRLSDQQKEILKRIIDKEISKQYKNKEVIPEITNYIIELEKILKKL